MEKSIYKLHESLEKYMNENIFSSILKKKFFFQFKNLSGYMEKNSISNYNKEVGLKYLIYRNIPGNSRVKENCSFRYDERYVTLLNGMLEGKWIIHKSKRDYYISFPGKFNTYIESFLQKYVEERRISDLTRKNYYRVLYNFCETMDREGVNTLSNLQSNMILNYISSKKGGQDHAVIILKALLKKMYEDQYVDYHTATILDNFRIKETRKLISYYTPEQVLCIEKSVDRKSAMGKRDYAMILLATRLGLRSSDILGLKFSNIDWDNNLIHLEQFKTKRRIELPLLVNIGDSIVDYIQHGRPKSDLKFIFLRAASPYVQMTNSALYEILNKYFRKSNVEYAEKKHGAHAMRHSLATNMLRNGTPLHVITESLGHESINNTMVYLNLDIDSILQCSMDVPMVDENFYLQKGEGVSWLR